MPKDQLTICPRCGSNACYETQTTPELKSYMCYGCGFTTNGLMSSDSEFLQEQVEVLPQLYQDLIYEDDDKLNWMPSTINLPNQGMIFIEGNNKHNWVWAACKAIELTEEEKPRFPQDTTHKMDMKNVKRFSERDFIEALDYIGIFESKEE